MSKKESDDELELIFDGTVKWYQYLYLWMFKTHKWEDGITIYYKVVFKTIFIMGVGLSERHIITTRGEVLFNKDIGRCRKK